jgi:hypothetical protein
MHPNLRQIFNSVYQIRRHSNIKLHAQLPQDISQVGNT